MSKETKNEQERLLVGRFLLITCSISNKTSFLFSKQTPTLSKNTFKTSFNLETFSKAQHFVYVLTNENYYKVCLNNGIFIKYFQKSTQSTFSNKSK